VLDPHEVRPDFGAPVVLVDLETQQEMQVNPDYAKSGYRDKMNAHIARLRERCRAAGMDYFLLQTDRPLDAALREYLNIRHSRN
jgi:uncharacterized protein (DUF58 family)